MIFLRNFALSSKEGIIILYVADIVKPPENGLDLIISVNKMINEFHICFFIIFVSPTSVATRLIVPVIFDTCEREVHSTQYNITA